MNEFEVIERYFSSIGADRDDVLVGIGDDAAVLAPDDQACVVCTDTMVAGVHFSNDANGADVGFKSLAVNLSDLAAMGAEPVWATLDLTLPDFDEAWVRDFCAGFDELARRHRVALVGGDTTRGPLTVSVQAGGRVPVGAALRRSGARPGHRIFMSGPVGDGVLGLMVANGRYTPADADAAYLLQRLQRPEPEIETGLSLRGIASSAIDVSDGLLADLGHVLDSSGGLGADLHVADNWFSDAGVRYLAAGGDPAELLGGGDDYVLVFTADVAGANGERQPPTDWIQLGTVVAEPGIRVRDADGLSIGAASVGYRHF